MNKTIANLAYLFIQKIRKQSVNRYIAMLQEAQFKPLHVVQGLRNEKLSKIINYTYEHVLFYRKKWDDCGVSVEDIECVDDLRCIPVLSKEEVLKNEKALMSTEKLGKIYTRKTGGSTGMTLHFKKEARALALNDAIMYRCYAWYGIDIGDRQVRFWGVPVTKKLRWKESLKDFILSRIRISAFDISKESCLRQFERIRRFKPDYFYGYTTAIYGFCLFMKELGIDLNELNLKAVICTAEKMYPHHRKLFDEVFSCPVVDEYGSSENGIIAFQCPSGNMHIMSDHMVVEFLDEDDQPVGPGQVGRIVITDLSCHAMPLIRYDIGDMGSPSDRVCDCGVNLPLMEIVEGRKEDFIRTVEGRLVHAAYLCYTLKDDAVHEFKMYQKSIDSFLVQIVKSPLFDKESEEILKQKLRSELGNENRINFEYLERIPRDKSGKLRYFVSELNNLKEPGSYPY